MLVSLTIGSSAEAALKTYVATCNGAQVVPPQNNAATCSATLTLDDSARTVWGTITFSGITPTVGRIEQGGALRLGRLHRALHAPRRGRQHDHHPGWRAPGR